MHQPAAISARGRWHSPIGRVASSSPSWMDPFLSSRRGANRNGPYITPLYPEQDGRRQSCCQAVYLVLALRLFSTSPLCTGDPSEGGEPAKVGVPTVTQHNQLTTMQG